jgi:glutamyl-Q tRNA(Asp) synthetase
MIPSRDQVAYRGRFAPSPTGPLHLGSLLAAWGSWLLARQASGQWLVRIEDLDPPRERPGAIEQQLSALQRFGLESDEPIVRQSERGPLYAAALDRLLAAGNAFVCHCSRGVLKTNGGIHRDCVATRVRGTPAVRFRASPGWVAFADRIQGVVRQDVAEEVGDFVLKRADGYWAYQMAVVIDDAAQGITEVVRGADLLDSTARQILLQRALGVTTPSYAHLPLVVDGSGRKLSKSLASLPVNVADPLPALRAVWALLGQSPGVLAGAGSIALLMATAQRCFDPSLIPAGPLPVGRATIA